MASVLMTTVDSFFSLYGIDVPIHGTLCLIWPIPYFSLRRRSKIPFPNPLQLTQPAQALHFAEFDPCVVDSSPCDPPSRQPYNPIHSCLFSSSLLYIYILITLATSSVAPRPFSKWLCSLLAAAGYAENLIEKGMQRTRQRARRRAHCR